MAVAAAVAQATDTGVVVAADSVRIRVTARVVPAAPSGADASPIETDGTPGGGGVVPANFSSLERTWTRSNELVPPRAIAPKSPSTSAALKPQLTTKAPLIDTETAAPRITSWRS